VSVVRFVGLLLAPLLAPVAIVVLGLAYLILYCALGLWQTWLRASRDPRYDPYWWTSNT
jgi:hypothetical protein